MPMCPLLAILLRSSSSVYVQASKRMQFKNVYLNDLKRAQIESAAAKCYDNDKTVKALDIMITAYKTHYGTSNKTLLK